jgi:hypothetical protein
VRLYRSVGRPLLRPVIAGLDPAIHDAAARWTPRIKSEGDGE